MNTHAGQILLHAGRFRDAAEAAAKATSMFSRPVPNRVAMLAQEGKLEEARHALAEVEKLDRIQYLGHFTIACAYAALGNADGAADRLNQAFNERDPQLPFIKLIPFPCLKGILPDPRIQAIIRKLRLPP